MASYLNKYGLIPWFSASVVKVVSAAGLAWQPAFLVVVLLYFYSHYMFASGAAHIGAMYTAFLSVLVACGAPPVVSALVLGIFSNIMGCTTHYGIGSAPPFFGAGYVPLPTQEDRLRPSVFTSPPSSASALCGGRSSAFTEPGVQRKAEARLKEGERATDHNYEND